MAIVIGTFFVDSICAILFGLELAQRGSWKTHSWYIDENKICTIRVEKESEFALTFFDSQEILIKALSHAIPEKQRDNETIRSIRTVIIAVIEICCYVRKSEDEICSIL